MRVVVLFYMLIWLAGCNPNSLDTATEENFGSEVVAVPDASTKVSRKQAIQIALQAFRAEAPGDDWYREEHLSALLVKQGNDVIWSISCSASPIAGGGGSVLIDATSGVATEMHVPKGLR